MKDFFVSTRSALAGTVGLTSTLLNSIFVLLATPFGDKVQYKFVRGWANSCHYALRFITGISYEVIGKEKLPDEASIVYMKHQSIWEIIILFRIVPQMVFVFKREAMSIPIFGRALISMKMIDIDRSSGRTAVSEVIEKGTDRINHGLWIGIFPEGTRMPFGKTRRFGKSGIYLAKEANAPLVLLAHNGGEFWPSKSLKIRSGHVKVVISDPIETQNRDIEDITTECEMWMEKTMHEISPAYAKKAKLFAQQENYKTQAAA